MTTIAQNPTQAPHNKKALLHNNLSNLNINQIVKPARTIADTSVYNGPHGATTAPRESTAPLTPPDPRTPDIEETVSIVDPVKKVPGQNSTRLNNDPVKIRPSQKMTGSENDPVTLVNHKLPRLPQYLQTGALKPKDHFTAVPNCLFRDRSPFETPNDFMIYLRLFGVSYGFGRNTCDMGLAELMTFTGLCKNSVRKSIDRLEKQGWIKMIGDYEAGQISRKWRVLSPWEKGFTPEPTYISKDGKQTGANSDGVKNRPGQIVPQRGSEIDPVTVSKNDTYSNTQEPNKFKNTSLSQISENLRTYFDQLRPERKRESEQRAFEEIRHDFTTADIESALDHVRTNGLPGGEPCHSPMAYLASAISDVLAIVKTKQEINQKRAEKAALIESERRQEAEKEALERQEWDRRERAFNSAFADDNRQQEVIAELCREHKFFTTRGPAARSFAVSSWYLNNHEQMRATA